MISALVWWLVVSLLGWTVWPATRRMFANSPDRGWALTRLVGLVLASYLYWLASSIGFVPAGRTWATVASLICLLGGIAAWWWLWRGNSRPLVGRWREVAITEVVFTAAWVTYLVCRAGFPAIHHTEQPMDLAMLSATLHSHSMPPMDPWLAGEPISYYYGGYLLVGVIAHVTRTPAPVAYNLGLGLYAALTTSTVYGALRTALASTTRPTRARAIAVIGAVAAVGFSNLEPALELLQARYGIASLARWFGVPGLAEAPVAGCWLPPGTWWWRASRIASDVTLLDRPGTLITEFPAFSLLLGDLHPHLMGLPFLAYALAVAAEILVQRRQGLGQMGTVAASVLVLGYAGFVNTWDLPVVVALVGAAWGLGRWLRSGCAWLALGEAALVTAGLLGAGGLLYAPFYAQFGSQVQGLGIVVLTRTRLRSFVLHWGVWYVPIVLDLLLVPQQEQRSWMRVLWLWVALAIVPWVAVATLGGVGKLGLAFAGAALQGPWVGIMLAGLAALMVDDLWSRSASLQSPAPRLALFTRLTALGGTALILGAEFFFVHDLFGTRMNTVFKVYQQAWMLLAVAGVCAAYRLYRCGRHARWGLAPVILVWLVALPYLPMAAVSRWKTSVEPWTLDGASYLSKAAPDAYAAYLWLSEVCRPGDVLAAAPGVDYDASSSQLSALTGVPTILGWPGHEVQWRGSDDMLAPREADLRAIYTSRDVAKLGEALERYGVRYVYVSQQERAMYGLNDEHVAWLTEQLDLAFATGEVLILRVPASF